MANVRDKAKRQHHRRNRKPNPPGALPEMVVHHRGYGADDEPHPKPRRLAFDEKINIAMRIARESARAKQHNDADHEHQQHRDEHDVGAFAMHQMSVPQLAIDFFCLRFLRDDQLLADLQFVRIIDVIDRQ